MTPGTVTPHQAARHRWPGPGGDPGLVRHSSAGPAVAPARGHPVGCPGQRDHAAADARRPGAAGVCGLAGPVADARVAGGVPGRGGGAGLGAARLPAAGDPPACDGAGPGGPARRGGPGVGGRAAGAARHRLLHGRRGGQLRVRAAARGAGHQRAEGAGPAGRAAGSCRHPARRWRSGGWPSRCCQSGPRWPRDGRWRSWNWVRWSAPPPGRSAPAARWRPAARGAGPGTRRMAAHGAARSTRARTGSAADGCWPCSATARARCRAPGSRPPGRISCSATGPWTAWWRTAWWTRCRTGGSRCPGRQF